MRHSSLIFTMLLVAFATPAMAQDRTETIEVSGSSADILVWEAEGEARGLILFGHGWGGSPAQYDRLFEAWSARGFTVRAPIFIDSPAHGDADGVDATSMASAQRIVGNRFETVGAEREAAAAGDLPVILGGHSFGALVSQFHAEGKWAFGPLGGEKPAGVIAFSSPGEVPMLVPPAAYADLDVPYMMITGTADDVGAGKRVWEEHRLAFDRSKAGDKTLVIVEGGKHNLIAFREEEDEEKLFVPVTTLTGLFLDAYAGGDEEAAAALEAIADTDLIRIERR